MASLISIKTNLDGVAGIIQKQLDKLNDKEYLLRPVAQNMIVLLHRRIHVDGKDSNAEQIGLYSKGYLALRSGLFQNTHIIQKGANKGKPKGSGTFTSQAHSEKVGKPRPNYNRGTDPKVIISLTRQLENDYAVKPTVKGYGIGFNNEFNFQKSQFVQETYHKQIFALTDEEEKEALKQIQDLVNDVFK